MTTSTRPEPVDLGEALFWPARLAVRLLETQQLHWQALSAWHQAMAALQTDWYDRWSCRFADGARIDD